LAAGSEHVGLSPEEADERGIAADTYTQSFGPVDRAVLDGSTEGFVRVHTRKGKDRILGRRSSASTPGS
jgi:pyruvate/2-oxoglutarate dehydrogenase complex dihydrolipoamide dehydrogenase (E3) component